MLGNSTHKIFSLLEREAGEANLDVTGAGGDGEKKKKTV